MKNFFLFLFILFILLLVVLFINTFRFSSRQVHESGNRKNFLKDSAAVQHLAGAIRIRTITFDDDSLTNFSAFDTLRDFLQDNYPLTFSALRPEIINKHSLLFEWSGSDAGKKPVIIYAHLDVVAANDSSKWQHPPFGGLSDADCIYGRGAIDDKGSIIAILESVEQLLKNNFIPQRTIYIAFGHDEEREGEKGAKFISYELRKRGVKAEFLLDEGGLVATGMVPFVKHPVAMIFTSEKGGLSLKLSVNSDGGHSSHPPADPPIETLSKAILAIQRHPFERKMTESVDDFMDYTGPEMSFPFKTLFANRWLFGPIISGEYEKISSGNAMIHTTAVATVINGGEKENVIPSEVSAIINFRLLPGDSSDHVIERVRKVINDDRVEIGVIGRPDEASVVSSTKSESFLLLSKVIGKTFPDAIVAPSLLIAQTDSRHFKNVTENIYRFLPVRMDDKILDTMHGKDERIRIADFMESIEFYRQLFSDL